MKPYMVYSHYVSISVNSYTVLGSVSVFHEKSRQGRTIGAIRDQKYNPRQHQLEMIFTQTDAMLLFNVSKFECSGLE